MGEAVVEGEDDEHHGTGIDSDDGTGLLDVGSVVTVRQEDALGVRRRAGSVADVGVIVRTDGTVAGHELLLMGSEELLAGLLDGRDADLRGLKFFEIERRVIENYDLLDLRALGKYLADLGELVLGDKHPFGLRVDDAENEVAAVAEIDRQRHVDGACIQRAHLGQHPHRTALGEQGDLVAFRNAEGHQSRAYAVDPLPRLRKRDLLPLPVHLLPKICHRSELLSVLFNKINNG